MADDRDDEYMDTDFAYQSIEHKKNRRCPCICSDRKASAMLMLAPGDKSSVNLNKRFCRYSRLCCIRAVLIVLVIIAVLGIIALLLWQFAVPSFVSLYLKSTEIDFGYVSLTDNLPDGTKVRTVWKCMQRLVLQLHSLLISGCSSTPSKFVLVGQVSNLSSEKCIPRKNSCYIAKTTAGFPSRRH